MTKEEAIDRLREVVRQSGGDPEAAHVEADGVLCALLNSLGYGEVVDEWAKVDKWYA